MLNIFQEMLNILAREPTLFQGPGVSNDRELLRTTSINTEITRKQGKRILQSILHAL